MNALVKKEIRLLLPSWLAVLGLEVSLPWIWRDLDSSFMGTPFFMFLGIILLSVDSFGRECNLGTLSALLAQPMERRQIWRTKIGVLLPAAIMVLAAYFTSCELRTHLTIFAADSVWRANPKIIGADFGMAMAVSIGLTFVALSGGLWTTLMFRQTAVAFWVAFLVPTGLFMLITLVMSQWFGTAPDVAVDWILSLAVVIYSVSSFWLARWLWFRTQDFAWTGGVISFSCWRYLDAGSATTVSVRRRKPLSALLKKEFQLNSLGLIGVGSLLVLHLAIFFLRGFHANVNRFSMTNVIYEMFWVLWLVVPLMLGCMAVAEERKLGLAEAQLCLPVSRRVQFFAKFIPVIVFGTLLGGVMPLVLEQLAGHLGAPNAYFRPESHGDNWGIPGMVLFETALVLLAAALALVGFYASTLARNFLQALSIAIVIIVGCCLFIMFLFSGPSGGDEQMALWGMKWWGPLLPLLIGIPTATVLVPWLACRNFSQMVEGGRLWRRNVFGIGGAIIFTLLSSGLIHNRAWEVFEPVESAHGPSVFLTTDTPKLSGNFRGDFQVQFPDGRIWCDSLGYTYFEREMNNWNWFLWSLCPSLPGSAGPLQFIAGSNWISATTRHVEFWNDAGGPSAKIAGYLDTVGIQTNGTLWISSEVRPFAWNGADMTQFRGGTNWRQVIRIGDGLLLLKADGTLWQWGTNHINWEHWQNHWPTLRTSPPQQLCAAADWRMIIFNDWNQGLARKKDGSVWTIDSDWKFERDTNLDQINLQNFSASGPSTFAFIRPNGTLWVSLNGYQNSGSVESHSVFQIGRETNWVAAVIDSTRLVALKSDGTLWQWQHFQADYPGKLAETPPTRLGIHDDWIGLSNPWSGVVTLAADGSLWFWPNPDIYAGSLMKAPKQPKLLAHVPGNIH